MYFKVKQGKHVKNAWNLFKVNKDTRTMYVLIANF